jgi:hypothetical protein
MASVASSLALFQSPKDAGRFDSLILEEEMLLKEKGENLEKDIEK